MTHEELRDRLLDLAYGELSPRDARAVEEHAASCEACGAELARIRGTRRMMSALPREAAPEAGERILLAAARQAVREKERRRGVPRWLWATPVVAASLAAVVAVSLRLGAVAPPHREDPNALLGPSPYAQAPAAPAPAAVAAAPEQAAPADHPAPPRAAEKKAEAPGARARDEESRWATAPPPAPAEERAAPAAPAAPPPPMASAAPSAPAAPSPPAPPAAAGAAPRRAAPSADGYVAGLRIAPEAKGEAEAPAPAPAPAPQRSAKAKALSVPQAAPGAGAAADAGSLAEHDGTAVARYEELRRSGRLRAEVRAFPACPREPWRRVERDPDGRIVSYAWESMPGGHRLRLEAIYGPDGTLALKRAFDAETGAPETFAKFRAPPVGEIDLDAPTVCDR